MARGTFPSLLDEEELKKLTKGIKADEWTEAFGLDEVISQQLAQAQKTKMQGRLKSRKGGPASRNPDNALEKGIMDALAIVSDEPRDTPEWAKSKRGEPGGSRRRVKGGWEDFVTPQEQQRIDLETDYPRDGSMRDPGANARLSEIINRENEKDKKQVTKGNTGEPIKVESGLPSLDPINQAVKNAEQWQNDNPWDTSFLGGSKEEQAKMLATARKIDLAPYVASGERMADGGSTVFTRDNKGNLIGRGRSGMQNERGIKIMTRAERRKYDAMNPFEGETEKALKTKIDELKKQQPADKLKNKLEETAKINKEVQKELNQKNITDKSKSGVGQTQGGMNIGLGKSGISVNTKTGKVSAPHPLLLAAKFIASVLGSNRKPGGGIRQTRHSVASAYDPYHGVYTG